jgi:ribonuclease-3
MVKKEKPKARENKSDVSDLERKLGHRFADQDLFKQALTHASTVGRKHTTSYERLEFLGDRVLGLVIAELLLEKFPQENEGAIAKRHAALVQEQALAVVARQIELADKIKISGNDIKSNRDNDSILSDVCEALIGALYLDGGLSVAKKFILPYWTPLSDELAEPPQEPKTSLQEWAQARALPLPKYEIVQQTGPAHAPVFEIKVTVEGLPSVKGKGSSRRAAEKVAAAKLLEKIAGNE